MQQRICLVTGGAGFIGSEFLRQTVDVYGRLIVVDSLLPQVHATTPSYRRAWNWSSETSPT
ncbi:MAG: hypothetical protein ABWY12_04650 [Burkholderiales bacterium]